MAESQPQMGEGRHISLKPGKGEGQQSGFHDDSPSASEMTLKRGALSKEQSKQSAEEEEKEIAKRKGREWTTSISSDERKRIKEAGDLTMENLGQRRPH